MKIQVAVLALLLAACSKPGEPATTTASPTPTTSATSTSTPNATATATATARPTAAGDLAWDVPAKWQTAASPSTMRKATYKIAKTAGDADDPEMSVMQAGGGLEANIDRWAGQFGGTKDVKRSKVKIGNFDVTVVEIKGTFAGSGMPGAPAAGPKDHWALLGAIVEGVDPPYFFKLTGPDKSVAAARPDFDKLVGSLRAK
jgi:hypothetical protein